MTIEIEEQKTSAKKKVHTEYQQREKELLKTLSTYTNASTE